MRYQFWGTDGTISCVVPENMSENDKRTLIDSELDLLDTVEVDSLVEAIILMHRRNDWEPYEPMVEDQEAFVVACNKLGITPAFITSTREPDDRIGCCPNCGVKLDGWVGASFSGPHSPHPNDLSFCSECGTMNQFNDDLTLRPADDGWEQHVNELQLGIVQRVKEDFTRRKNQGNIPNH